MAPQAKLCQDSGQCFSSAQCQRKSEIASLSRRSVSHARSLFKVSQYLSMRLDRILSFREHLAKTAGKLKTERRNLLMKLVGSSCSATAETLRSSALALCYSVAEYCALFGLAQLTQAELHDATHLWHLMLYSTPLVTSSCQH